MPSHLTKLNPWDIVDPPPPAAANMAAQPAENLLSKPRKDSGYSQQQTDSLYDDFARSIDLGSLDNLPASTAKSTTNQEIPPIPVSQPHPKIAMSNTSEGCLVKIDVPGVSKTDVQIDIRDGSLVISLKDSSKHPSP